MQRHEWTFSYGAASLAEAAVKKAAHRRERLQWWEIKRGEVMREVKDSGIEVSESLAQNYSNNSVGRGPQVMVRADLQSKLSECHAKIKEHDDAARLYDGWVQVLTANTTATLALHYDDWLFFFGR